MELVVNIICPFHTLENGKATVHCIPCSLKQNLHVHKIIQPLNSVVLIAGLTERYG